MSANIDKRIQPIHSTEKYAYKTRRMTCVKTKKLNSNPNFSQIPDHSCRILLIGGSRLGKTNALLNSSNHQLDIGKICLCANHPYEAKYWLLIKKM